MIIDYSISLIQPTSNSIDL